MTTIRSPAEKLLRSVGLEPLGPAAWGTPPTSVHSGVYLVETQAPLPEPPIDAALVEGWLAAVPTLRVDGVRPTIQQLSDRLKQFWIPNQPIVYIGSTTGSLRGRVRDYYRTPLGDPRPHAGGHWIRTLAGIDGFRVWWAEAESPGRHEDELLVAFARLVPAKIRAMIPGEEVVLLPFANRENAAGTLRKPHRVSGAVIRSKGSTTAPTTSGSSTLSATKHAGSRRRGTVAEINAALQAGACADPDRRIAAVPAAADLERRGVLPDSRQRPGKPLRDLLRAGLIDHAYQEPNGRWWIPCAGGVSETTGA